MRIKRSCHKSVGSSWYIENAWASVRVKARSRSNSFSILSADMRAVNRAFSSESSSMACRDVVTI